MEYILLSLVGVYTGLLVWLGRAGRKRAKNQNFLTGGRQFNAWQVFFMISALWCSWIFIVEIETAYLFGLSAAWFGVSVGIMAVASILVFGTPFAKLSFVTNSGIIGERFGAVARVIAAAVIGLTFPIFAMSNILTAAAFFHILFGWPFLPVLIGTALVVLAYVLTGGIWSLAYTQIANFVVMTVGLVMGTYWSLHVVPPHTYGHVLPARYLAWNGVGTGLILTWLFADLLNVVSAQAEFQILMAATDMKTARRGLYGAVGSIIVFSIGSAIIGLTVRAGTADPKMLGVFAFPTFYMHHVSGINLAIMGLSVWAAALTWSAPLMFSGASSLGADILQWCRKGRLSTNDWTKACVQICLPIQAVLIVLYALVRPDQLAWWQVFSLTIRNGAIFAPTVALLVWPVVAKRATIASIIAGSGAGFLWNVLGHFSTTHFVLGLNPMWISASTGILVIVLGTLIGSRGNYRLRRASLGQWSTQLMTAAIVGLLAILGVFWTHVTQYHLLGVALLMFSLGIMVLSALLTENRPMPSERLAEAVQERA